MRVLLATPDYPPMTGGVQLLCTRLVEHSRFDYDVITVSSTNGSVESQRTPNVTRLPRVGSHRFGVVGLNMVTLSCALARRPDAVMSGHIVAGPAALSVQRLLGVPAIQYLHSSELGARPRLAQLVTRRASASIAVSSYTRDQALMIGAPAGRLHVIYPGVDLAVDPIGKSVSDIDQRPTVMTLARLEDRYKGFDVMIAALPLVRARVPAVRWVLIGEGSLRPELEAMARAVGVADAITFTGSVSDAERDRWFSQANVFAMPSRVMVNDRGGEGFGIVFLEAGAHGLPCVAGNVGGSVDAVLDGTTGITVDPTDHVAVAEAISALLLDPMFNARLGEAGRARASQFTWDRMAEQVDDLVEHLVVARRSAFSFSVRS